MYNQKKFYRILEKDFDSISTVGSRRISNYEKQSRQSLHLIPPQYGAVINESPLANKPNRKTFSRRNRTISRFLKTKPQKQINFPLLTNLIGSS
jgi:predicted Rossmann fold nucleotide-binding protein DprA/Smf involved in DNA uptake